MLKTVAVSPFQTKCDTAKKIIYSFLPQTMRPSQPKPEELLLSQLSLTGSPLENMAYLTRFFDAVFPRRGSFADAMRLFMGVSQSHRERMPADQVGLLIAKQRLFLHLCQEWDRPSGGSRLLSPALLGVFPSPIRERESLPTGMSKPYVHTPIGRLHMDHSQTNLKGDSLLGKGTYGKVKTARSDTGDTYAVKTQVLWRIQPEEWYHQCPPNMPLGYNYDCLMRMSAIMHALQCIGPHPFVMPVLYAYTYDDGKMYDPRDGAKAEKRRIVVPKLALVMPMGECDGLFFVSRSDIGFKHRVAMLYCASLGIAHIHRQGYVHCDLKLENLILFPESVQVADFDMLRPRWLRSYEDLTCFGATYCSPDAIAYKNSTLPYSEVDLAASEAFSFGVVVIQALHATFGMRFLQYAMGDNTNPKDHPNPSPVYPFIQKVTDGMARYMAQSQTPEDALVQRLVLGLLAESPKDRWTVDRASQTLFQILNEDNKGQSTT